MQVVKLKKKCGAIKLRLEYLLSIKEPLLLNFINSSFSTVPTKHLILVYKIALSRTGLYGGRPARGTSEHQRTNYRKVKNDRHE